MLDNQILVWLQTISSWYIILPLLIVILRWKSFDLTRRRVAWYVFFNIGFTAITMLLGKKFLDINNLFIFYLGSPIFVWIIYRIFESQIGKYKFWQIFKWVIIVYAIFAVIDMFWIEDFRTKFPNNIYPIQSVIILAMTYYFLYIFSKEARKDFSALWISIGIGTSALLIFFMVVYFPYLGFKANTFGYFVWMSLGSVSTILTYSFISYGLWIAKPKT